MCSILCNRSSILKVPNAFLSFIFTLTFYSCFCLRWSFHSQCSCVVPTKCLSRWQKLRPAVPACLFFINITNVPSSPILSQMKHNCNQVFIKKTKIVPAGIAFINIVTNISLSSSQTYIANDPSSQMKQKNCNQVSIEMTKITPCPCPRSSSQIKLN